MVCIHCKTKTKKEVRGFYKKKIWIFKAIFEVSFINLLSGHLRSHAKIGPDHFSRLDFYWIKTNKQTARQTKTKYRKTRKRMLENIPGFELCIIELIKDNNEAEVLILPLVLVLQILIYLKKYHNARPFFL